MNLEGKIINFSYKGKKLFFEYLEYVRDNGNDRETYRVYELTEEIPQKLVQKGNKTAIKKYAEKKIADYKKKAEKKWKGFRNFEKNSNFPLKVSNNNITLKGKIVSAKNNTLTVELFEPFQGKKTINYGWASAMAGKYILEQHSKKIKFSDNAITTAKKMLIDIYQEEYEKANNPVARLANKLNK